MPLELLLAVVDASIVTATTTIILLRSVIKKGE
jgi:energy-converting hydrogenase Eha subunit E